MPLPSSLMAFRATSALAAVDGADCAMRRTTSDASSRFTGTRVTHGDGVCAGNAAFKETYLG